jgi:cytochrome c oxidase subunit 2
LCGKDHGFMPVVVEVVSEEQYAAWVAKQKTLQVANAEDRNKVWTFDEQKAEGARVYAANCAACHQTSGAGLPPAIPALDGSKVVKGSKADHLTIVLKGRTGTAMASFADRLTDTEVAAVVVYERNSWRNRDAGVIPPAEVRALRGQ